MDDIESLFASGTKGQFLIAHLGLPNFFTQLSTLPIDERHYLARELIETRFSYNFADLIDALIFANIREKGDHYLREGHQDFLGFLMQALIRHIDGCYIEAVYSFKHYRPSQEVVEAITKIGFFIQVHDAVAHNNLFENFAANILAGIFYPLWIKSERISDTDVVAVASYFESHKKDQVAKNTWVHARFGDYRPTINRLERRQHLFAKYQADVDAVLDYVTRQSWSNKKIFIFTTGMSVCINGQKYIVPSNVSKIVRALQSNYARDPDIIVTWLALEREAQCELSTPKLMSPALRGLYDLVLARRQLIELNMLGPNIIFEPPHLEAPPTVISAQAGSHP